MRSMGRRGSHRLRIRRGFAEKALITFPFHDPSPDRAMTVANQLRVEHRRAPRSPQAATPAANAPRCTIHLVSAVEGCGCGRDPQHQAGDAGSLRGQGQLAAGDQIELPRLAPDFQHHRADARRRPAHRRRCATRYRHRPRARVTSRRGSRPSSAKPAHRQRAGFNLGKILAHPDQRTPRRQPSRQSPRRIPSPRALCRPSENTSCTAPVARPPRKHRIRAGMAERHPMQRMRIARRLQAVRCCRARRASVFVRALLMRRSFKRLSAIRGSLR